MPTLLLPLAKSDFQSKLTGWTPILRGVIIALCTHAWLACKRQTAQQHRAQPFRQISESSSVYPLEQRFRQAACASPPGGHLTAQRGRPRPLSLPVVFPDPRRTTLKQPSKHPHWALLTLLSDVVSVPHHTDNPASSTEWAVCALLAFVGCADRPAATSPA